jgi:hypothetical protein
MRSRFVKLFLLEICFAHSLSDLEVTTTSLSTIEIVYEMFYPQLKKKVR